MMAWDQTGQWKRKWENWDDWEEQGSQSKAGEWEDWNSQGSSSNWRKVQWKGKDQEKGKGEKGKGKEDGKGHPQNKRTICKHWERGKCLRDPCGWAHGEQELGKPIHAPKPPAGTSKKDEGIQKWESMNDFEKTVEMARIQQERDIFERQGDENLKTIAQLKQQKMQVDEHLKARNDEMDKVRQKEKEAVKIEREKQVGIVMTNAKASTRVLAKLASQQTDQMKSDTEKVIADVIEAYKMHADDPAARAETSNTIYAMVGAMMREATRTSSYEQKKEIEEAFTEEYNSRQKRF